MWLRRQSPDPRSVAPAATSSEEGISVGTWELAGHLCFPTGRLCGNQGLPGYVRALTPPTYIPAHIPSMRISMTSFTLKLSSSTSWPTYWYSARHRGPCVRGWGLGRPTPGTGRCPTLRFLCMLWGQVCACHSPRYSPTTCPPPGAAFLPHLPSHTLIWHVEEFCVVL